MTVADSRWCFFLLLGNWVDLIDFCFLNLGRSLLLSYLDVNASRGLWLCLDLFS